MARADELDREVNRLYWHTGEPVTRLAEQLAVSRGTFYNHLRPLPAGANCSTCGGRLLFRNRSSRDAGEAHCAECGAEERVGGTTAAAGSAPRTSRESRAAPRPGAAPRPQAADARGSKARVSGPAKPVRLPRVLEDDEQRTRLLLVAIGAAALGLGVLYYARHRS